MAAARRWTLAATAALLAVTAAHAATVDKCRWVSGMCEATPAHLLAIHGGKKAPSPMAENVLRSFALDAACLVRRDEKSCGAVSSQKGCGWEDGVCAVDPEWAEAKLEDTPSMTGCPGTLSAAVGVCKSADNSKQACATLGSACAWLDGTVAAEIVAAAGDDAEQHPNAFGPVRSGGGASGKRASAGAAPKKGGVVAAAVLPEEAKYQLLAPGGERLVGCVPSELRRLALERDYAGLDRANAMIDGQMPQAYGTCEQDAEELMARCQDAYDRRACGAIAECAWDGGAEECTARQAPWIAGMFGATSRAATAARSCAAIKNAASCASAGHVEFDASAAVRSLFPLPAPVSQGGPAAADGAEL